MRLTCLFVCLNAILLITLINVGSPKKSPSAQEDNEFAEFEDFDDEPVKEESAGKQSGKAAPSRVADDDDDEDEVVSRSSADATDDDEVSVEDEADEFEHLQDEEEFEGFDKDRPQKSKSHDKPPPDLKITNVPLHLHTNWDSFYLEILMLAGLGVYLLNFVAGRNKNSKLAHAWLNTHKELLEANFHIVGDDGTGPEIKTGSLVKESENVYALWCSGRVCCEGMLVTLKFIKRQDLINTVSRLFKPASDQIMVKVTMNAEDMDSVLLCVANKKTAPKLLKSFNDLSLYNPEKKTAEKYGIPSSFQLFGEVGEALVALLDQKVIQCLNKYEHLIDYIHFSDQYSGTKQADESVSKLMETSKVLSFCFNVPGDGRSQTRNMDEMKPLMQLVFYCIDKVRRFRLSREGKAKADQCRQKVQEQLERAAHNQRSEAAQQRKEDKKRAEKERIMKEDDPEKQRRLEEKSIKKEKKKGGPKVKMLKVKGM